MKCASCEGVRSASGDSEGSSMDQNISIGRISRDVTCISGYVVRVEGGGGEGGVGEGGGGEGGGGEGGGGEGCVEEV